MQPRTIEVSCSLPSLFWGGEVRVQEFYGKCSRSQLSSAWVDSFGRRLERDFSYISIKGSLTTRTWIEAGNVVTHMGLYISNVTVSCSLCAIICNELFTDRHRCPDVLCIVVMLVGYVVNWNSMSMDYKVLRLCKWKSVVGILVMELCRGRTKSPRTSRMVYYKLWSNGQLHLWGSVPY
ncbi:ty3-gypsy retrotransposon protein [Cucumis melo var. makuwa]|uniref:Ty3-gypsy retrotransposon protein n=1 Tax=Cucumis melo var. makuwa TaxID=1194695 RepID=A0A5A7TE65_CUCMM|nr:ty3-gypsy retrotransposon protein [Cucumis melo var. makuwa]TYK06325.1 ty3-gypsy retrotransposon protein [Cucumis melo var. makuwa]